MPGHRIRLRGHWETSPREDSVQHLRRFGQPGQLDAEERVWLIISGSAGSVTVNSTALADAPGEWDITALLQPRNELKLLLAVEEEPGEVVLEIRK